MKQENALKGSTLRVPYQLACLLLNRRARQTVLGLVMLRRAHEHVLMMAALEGVREDRRLYYDGYVDALEILGTRALWVARAL
jgi:hypothetical protein